MSEYALSQSLVLFSPFEPPLKQRVDWAQCASELTLRSGASSAGPPALLICAKPLLIPSVGEQTYAVCTFRPDQSTAAFPLHSK